MAEDHKGPVDHVTGISTTGQEWDGIRELNTPLPRWWLWLFYITIIWSIGYWIVYPSWPLVSSYTAGTFGWHSREAISEEMAALTSQRGELASRLASASLEEIRNTPELLEFASAQGRIMFAENCGACHGSGGAGAKGYPNLNDDEWLWGGKLDDIHQTIRHGIRFNDQSRQGSMPAFGRDGTLKRAEISNIAEYVRSLSNLPTDKTTDLQAGAALFAQNCAACHGDAGKGNRELGAPNLTDSIWLYGSDKAVIAEAIHNGRGAVMPAWEGRLDPVTIKALTVYVHSRGGGE